jgi:hypothetical protein
LRTKEVDAGRLAALIVGGAQPRRHFVGWEAFFLPTSRPERWSTDLGVPTATLEDDASLCFRTVRDLLG